MLQSTSAMRSKQQIQQMNIPEEDNGINIFDQLKHLFFDDHLDNEQVASLICQEPIKHIDRILLTLTQQYSRKLDEIVEPLQQQRNHLAVTLMEVREKLHHSLQDNEYFKTIIDHLEDERKDTQAKLNQSICQMQRSQEQAIYQMGESEKIKHEACKLFENYQQIYDQYIKFKEINSSYERQISTLKTQHQSLKSENEKCLANNIEITNKFHLLSRQLEKQKQQNNGFIDRIAQKQEFIASFVEEYNNFHFFSQQEASDQHIAEEKESNKQAGKNELKYLNFNSFIDEEVSSKKSSNPRSSVHKLSTQIDSASKHEENHSNAKFESPNKFKKSRVISNKPPGLGVNHIQIKDKYGSCMKGMNKAISSRNLHQKSKNIHPNQSTQQDEKKMIQTVLKNKITEKNQKIINLESEMMNLRIQFIEQRENITVMEGDYELQIDELKNQLLFTKNQLSSTQKCYLLARVQSEAYSDKNRQLEEQLQALKEEHKTYRQQFKMRCKAFVIDRMDQMQRQYEKLIKQTAHVPTTNDQNIQTHEIFISNNELHRRNQNNNSLHLHPSEESKEEGREQILSFSELQSYDKLSSHYINAVNFDLNLSNCKFVQPIQEERGSRQMFQIQSDLGNFTERMNEEKECREKDCREKRYGNFTDRCIKEDPIVLDEEQIKESKEEQINIQINSNVYEIAIPLKAKLCTISEQPKINILPPLAKNHFDIVKSVAHIYEPISKLYNLAITSSIDSIVLIPRYKHYKIYKTLETVVSQNRRDRIQISPSCRLTLKVVKHRKHAVHSQLITLNYIPKASTEIMTNQWAEFVCLQAENKRINDYQTDEQKYLQTSPSTTSLIGNYVHRLSLIRNTVDIMINEQVKIFNKDMHLQSKHKNLSMSRASTFNSICQMSKITIDSHPITSKAEHFEKAIPSLHRQRIQHFNLQRQEINYQKYQINYKQSPDCFKNPEISEFNNKQVYQTTIKQNQNLDTISTIKKSFEENPSYNLTESINNDSDTIAKPINMVQTIPCLKLSFNDTIDLSFENTLNLNKSQLKSDLSLSICSEKHEYSFSLQTCMKEEKKHMQTERNPMNRGLTSPEIDTKLNVDQNIYLNKYLENHKLSLTFQKLVDKNNFKKPNELDKKILILTARSKYEVQTFLLNSYQIYSLQSGRNIKFEKSKYVNQNNFMFGQSEVIITGNGHLIVNRSGKKKKLAGNLQDGDWLIDSYLVCGYSTIN